MGQLEAMVSQMEKMERLMLSMSVKIDQYLSAQVSRKEAIKKAEIAKILNISERQFIVNWKKYKASGCPVYLGVSGSVEAIRGEVELWKINQCKK